MRKCNKNESRQLISIYFHKAEFLRHEYLCCSHFCDMLKSLYHMHELFASLTFNYGYHFFNLKQHVSEMLADLIGFTDFERALTWTKIKNFSHSIHNIPLCLSELNLKYHCTNKTKKDKIGAHQKYFCLNKKYNFSGPPAFKSQRVGYQSNQKSLHHY